MHAEEKNVNVGKKLTNLTEADEIDNFAFLAVEPEFKQWQQENEEIRGIINFLQNNKARKVGRK